MEARADPGAEIHAKIASITLRQPLVVSEGTPLAEVAQGLPAAAQPPV
jgi:hypothetical protein